MKKLVIIFAMLWNLKLKILFPSVHRAVFLFLKKNEAAQVLVKPERPEMDKPIPE